MASAISPQALKALLDGDSQFALIDVRDTGEYNSTHIPDSSLIPRRPGPQLRRRNKLSTVGNGPG